MNVDFMESVWWVFKQLFDKKVVYRGYKVMPFSTALNTPLSNFEAQQNYKDAQDPAVVVSFPLLDDPSTSLLAWTTTPWTLPSHTGLAAHPDFEYVKIRDEQRNQNYILLEGLLKTVYKDPKKAKFKIVDRLKGRDMLGWKYEPPFDYFYEDFKDYGFRVLNATYVTQDGGVGIVHQAPAFGEEDYNVAFQAGVISEDRLPPNPVDERGCFTSEVREFAGQHVKTADKAILKHLKERGRIVVDSQITHSYPFCWRSDTPLIYRAVPAWFVKIPEVVPDMLKNIEQSHWVPSFVKERRFASWISNARDWNISRNRYWGTPIPLWASDDLKEIICVGSAAELKELSGHEGDIADLHRDKIDDITIPSQTGRGRLRRIEEVFDCWFESGSMPYASVHYPFENRELFERTFPGDFIAEGLDQTRGWFYTLVVLGTHLFGVSPFKNCVVSGIVLGEDGKKMSKRLKNYPDPSLIMDKYGADALRLYLINSPVVRAEPLRFKESGVKEVVSKVLLPLWNSYKFFDGQVALLKKMQAVDFMFDPARDTRDANVMDRWILASCQSLLKFVDQEMLGESRARKNGTTTWKGNWREVFSSSSLLLTRSMTCSLSPVHCRSTASTTTREHHELVHQVQPQAAERRARARRHLTGPQHALRGALHADAGVGSVHAVPDGQHLPALTAAYPGEAPRRGSPERAFLAVPRGTRGVVRRRHRAQSRPHAECHRAGPHVA